MIYVALGTARQSGSFRATSKWRLVATTGYFLPGGLVVPLRYRDRTVWPREGGGNEEMGECSKKKEVGRGERERTTGGAETWNKESGRGGILCVSFVAGFRLQ